MRADVTAVLLAGGGAHDPLARAFGVPAKALVPVGGLPMLVRIGTALAAASAVIRIVCVAAPAVAATLAAARSGADDEVELVAVPAGEDFAASLALGLGAALAFRPKRLLLLGADIPWLQSDDVTRFLAAASSLRAADGRTPALVYPLVPRAASEAAFPGQRRTWVRVASGAGAAPQQVTGGNLVLIDPAAAPRLLSVAAAAYRARKRPLALARLVGPAALAGLLTGRLRIDALERRVGALLGLPVRALVTDLPSLAADLDRPDQVPARGEQPPLTASSPPGSEENR